MSVEKAIYGALTDPDYGALVAAIAGARIYPVIAPQAAAYPNVVYRRRSTDRQYALDGNTNLPTAWIEVTACALTYSEARDLGNAIKSAMDGIANTWSGVVIHKVFIDDEFDDFQFQTEGKERPVFTVTIVLKVFYRE